MKLPARAIKPIRNPDQRVHITQAGVERPRYRHSKSLCGVHMVSGFYAPKIETLLNYLARHPFSLCRSCKRSYERAIGLDQPLRMPVTVRPATYTINGAPVDVDWRKVHGRK